MSLSFHYHYTLEEFKDLEFGWKQLHTNCTNPSIYNHFDFVYNSIKNFDCSETEPFLLTIHYKEELVGIFFLQHCIEKRMGLKVRVMEYCALDEIDKPYPVIHVNHSNRCWEGFFNFIRSQNDWDVLVFMEQTSNTIKSLSKLAKQQNMTFRINPDNSGPVIDLSQSWEDFWSNHKKMRKKLYKMEKDFSERLRFQIETGSILLNDYIQVESQSWKGGKVGISSNEQMLNFYHDMATTLDKDFYVGVLYVDDQPISAEIAYACNDLLYFCQGCFDQSMNKYSPGMVSTCLFLKHFMNDGRFKSGDYLCGYAGYLNAWSDEQVHTQRIDIYQPNWMTRLFFALRIVNKLTPNPIKRFAKDTYALLKNNP